MNHSGKLSAIIAAALLLPLSSCGPDNKEELSGNLVKQTFTFSLPSSPSTLGWNDGDGIDIFDSRYVSSRFTLLSASGKDAVFEGNILKQKKYVCISPSSNYNAWNGSAFTARLECYQNALEGSCNVKYMVSVADFQAADGGAQLEPAVAFVSLKGSFGGKDIESISIKCSGSLLSGTASVERRDGALAVTPKSGFDYVCLRSSGSETMSENRLYLACLWPGTYKNMSLEIRSTDGMINEMYLGDLNLQAGKLTALPEIKLDASDWGEETGPFNYACGKVSWKDGTPAAGICVSNGFSAVWTGADGKYRLGAGPDTRYIYISLPSNAKINVSNGCPDFFKAWDNMVRDYDFVLEKQAVESEFALFAMADPQAHYEARSPQKKADTKRFLDETVPALNNQISSLGIACYGVTLGDVVYSEGSRNSNPGLATMRSNFSKVKMPVFQTMGNHDYTFFSSNAPLETDSRSSLLNLKAQRAFEDCFGPVNFSFNRAKVHVVCMKDVQYLKTTDAASYECSFSDDQWKWLQDDLQNVPKDYSIVLCVHIPLAGNGSKSHVQDVVNLISQWPGSTVFSGHTHYYRGYANTLGSGLYEHIHSAVCGQWWWSRIEGDGCPNGYRVYHFEGSSIKDAWFNGFNSGMDSRDYQMRIYRGNLKNGGKYAYFQWMHGSDVLLINVFNGDSRWKVEVYENGVLKGNASLMSNSKKTYSSVTAGTTYEIPLTSNQDWWSIGYHIGVVGRGRTSTSYYTNMFHMWKYTLSNPSASVKVVATDPYGNKYECSDVVSADCDYPAYIKEL